MGWKNMVAVRVLLISYWEKLYNGLRDGLRGVHFSHTFSWFVSCHYEEGDLCIYLFIHASEYRQQVSQHAVILEIRL